MKKFLKIAFVTIFCLVLLVGIIGYVVLKQMDLNEYKGLIEAKVTEATGRQLKIGDIQLKASFTPTVELKNIEFANASWAKDAQMATIGSVDVGVSLVPLWYGQYVIDKFVIRNAVINLEDSVDNGANWVFVKGESAETDSVKKSKTSFKFELIKSAYAEDNVEVQNDVRDLLSNVVIKEVALDNVVVNYTDKSAKKQTFDVKKFSLDENDDENIDFDFDVNKGLYRGNGTLGALKLLKAKTGYPVLANINVMGIDVGVDATLFDVLGDINFDGKIKAKGFLGKDSTYKESAEVGVKGNLKEIAAVIESLSIADNVVTGNVSVKLNQDVPLVVATLNSDKIDIASFQKNDKSAWNVSLIKEAKATTMVSSDRIPYEALYGVDATADVNIGKIVNKNAIVMQNVALNAKVNKGVATLNVLNGTLAKGNVKAEAVLNAGSKTLNLTADVVKVNLIDLLKAFNAQSESINFISGSDTDLYVKLSGQGSTYASLVDGLNGRVAVIVDQSKLHLGNIGMIKGNIFSQLFNTLNLTKGNDDLELKCAVIRTDITDGKADFPNGIVFNADKFTVVANGDINLKNEKIGFSVKPFGGKLTDTNIAKALSSLVKLTGTLKEPAIGVDTANAVKNIVGATMTGAVYLGAQMVMENDNSPCYTALKNTGYESRFPESSNIAKSTTDNVGKALDDSVGMVKDTAQGLFNMLSGKSSGKEAK